MTDEDREFLAAIIDGLDAAEKRIDEAMSPFQKAAASIDEARQAVLERFGAQIVDRCEGCRRIIFEGDMAHACMDGEYLCENCAPTYGDIKAQYESMKDEDFEEPDERQASLDRIGAHVASGGSLDDKLLHKIEW